MVSKDMIKHRINTSKLVNHEAWKGYQQDKHLKRSHLPETDEAIEIAGTTPTVGV